MFKEYYVKVKGVFASNNMANRGEPLNVEGVLKIEDEEDNTGSCDGVLIYKDGTMQRVMGIFTHGNLLSFYGLKDKGEIVEFDGPVKIKGSSNVISSVVIPQQIEFYEKIELINKKEAETKKFNFGSDNVLRKIETGFAKHLGTDSLGYTNNILQIDEKATQKQYEAAVKAFEASVEGTPAEFLYCQMDSNNTDEYTWELHNIWEKFIEEEKQKEKSSD